MISNRFYKVIIVVVVLIATAFGVFHTTSTDDKLPITITAMQTSKGWGYEIFVDGKVFIKQPFVPVVAGEQSFKNKEQALAVGNIAVKKIVQGKTPSITKNDLKALHILQ